MSFPRLIPCLDVAHGRVVKCVRFEHPRDMGDPVELAKFYSDGGADELVFLDIAATVDGVSTMLDTVRRIAAAIDIPFTVGGGLRTLEDGIAFVEAGADRVALNTAAIAEPALVTSLSERFGAQAVVVAIDAREGMVHTHAGTRPSGLDAVEWARRAVSRGAGEILLTSIDADGTRNGYDLELTGKVADAVTVPVIASGGAGSARDVADALRVAQGAIAASIVHEDPFGLPRLRADIQACGVRLRPLTAEALRV